MVRQGLQALQVLQALRPLGQLAIVGVTPEMNINVFDDIVAEGKTMFGVIEGDEVPHMFMLKLIEYYKNEVFPFVQSFLWVS